MTNADWRATVKRPAGGSAAQQPRMSRARLRTLRRGTHEAALDLRHVSPMGTELLPTFAGELRRSRLYRSAEAFTAARAITPAGQCWWRKDSCRCWRDGTKTKPHNPDWTRDDHVIALDLWPSAKPGPPQECNTGDVA